MWERSDSSAHTFKEIPYETACELFEELTGLPLSAHTADEVTQEVSEGLTVLEVAPGREEILAKIVAVAEGQPWRPILVLAIDGADVPTRPDRIVQVLSWHQVQTDEAAAEALRQVKAAGLIPSIVLFSDTIRPLT